ncbi:MAG: hypothetical protein IPM39_20040 [Chloroflexi bacterium]|nr:hypothetical protein [Chloroflexota bacterium]
MFFVAVISVLLASEPLHRYGNLNWTFARLFERTPCIEVSNATGEFWDAIKAASLTQEDYHKKPQLAGAMLIQVVEKWHNKVSIVNGGLVDTAKSFYLVLQWERKSGRYQLFQFPVDLPDPRELSWQVDGRRLIGRDAQGVLFEWYGLSGGQLKYYPLASNALWQSPIFLLESLPDDLDNAVKQKALAYFPHLWQQAQEKTDQE